MVAATKYRQRAPIQYVDTILRSGIKFEEKTWVTFAFDVARVNKQFGVGLIVGKTINIFLDTVHNTGMMTIVFDGAIIG